MEELKTVRKQEAETGRASLRARHFALTRCVLGAATILLAGCGSGSGPGAAVGSVPGTTSTYDVTLSVIDPGPALGALQVDVDFLGASGDFLGSGASVSCQSLVPGALVTINRRSGGVSAGFIDLQGIVRPSALMSCRFQSRETVGVGDFGVRVSDASDTSSIMLNPLPDVRVTDVRLLQ